MQANANPIEQSKFNQTLLVDPFGQSYFFLPAQANTHDVSAEQVQNSIEKYNIDALLQNHSVSWGQQFDIDRLYQQVSNDYLAHHKSRQDKLSWLSRSIMSGEVSVFKGENFAPLPPTDAEGGIPVASVPEKVISRVVAAKESLGHGGRSSENVSEAELYRELPDNSSVNRDKSKRINPAQTINEATERLSKAKVAIEEANASNSPLPKTPYTLQDKLNVVENGLTENVLVRIIETDHSKDSGTIGQVKNGRAVTWTAPMSQVEHADSDAELILNAFGTRYNPNKNYTMLLIDKQQVADAGDVVSVIPTFDNMNNMIANNPDMGIDPSIAKKVMNEDFAPKYEDFANKAWDAGVDMDDSQERIVFAKSQGHDTETAELLSERHDIATKISAWEIFTGNGMTRDTNVVGQVAYGPVEVFTFDKNPQQLGKLESLGAIKRIDL